MSKTTVDCRLFCALLPNQADLIMLREIAQTHCSYSLYYTFVLLGSQNLLFQAGTAYYPADLQLCLLFLHHFSPKPHPVMSLRFFFCQADSIVLSTLPINFQCLSKIL